MDQACVGVWSSRVEMSVQGQCGGIAGFSSEHDQAEVFYTFKSSKTDSKAWLGLWYLPHCCLDTASS